MSTFTPNKNIQLPASGSFTNAWAAPINENFLEIDTCLGGLTTINANAVAAGTYPLTITQYQPLIIEVSGSPAGAITYTVPSGVGGIWSIINSTSGVYALNFACAGGNSVNIPPGESVLAISDGTNAMLAQSIVVAFSQLVGQILNSQVPASAVTQWQGSLALAGSQITSGAVAAANIAALPASQITSGTIANARLPNAAAGEGVTIAADPGTTPSGTFGQIFYYY